MDIIFELQIHIVSFAILLIIYVQLRDEVQIFSMRDKLFKYLVLSVMFPLCLDAASYIISGSSGQIMRAIHVGLQVLRFGSVPLPLLIWALYIILTVDCQEKYLSKRFIPMGILVIINTLIALSSPITKQYFSIDGYNIYRRGEGHWISIVIAAISFTYSLFIFIINWRKVNQRNRRPMLLFFVPPAIGMVFQTLFSGASLIWPTCAISILIIYTMIQSQIVKIDYLTGLYN